MKFVRQCGEIDSSPFYVPPTRPRTLIRMTLGRRVRPQHPPSVLIHWVNTEPWIHKSVRRPRTSSCPSRSSPHQDRPQTLVLCLLWVLVLTASTRLSSEVKGLFLSFTHIIWSSNSSDVRSVSYIRTFRGHPNPSFRLDLRVHMTWLL